MSKGLVCVTGASGFVGSHVVQALLESGYRVRAAVRDPADGSKVAHLRALGDVELVRGDLERPGSFDEAMKGVDHVIHSASAVILTAKDPQREIVDVAVEGTRNVIGAALASPTVGRIVQTSSVSAVVDETRRPGRIFDETDWNDSADLKSDPYAVSKVQAEKVAHALVAASDRSDVTCVSLQPTLVLGPVMTEAHLRTSPAILFELVRGAWPGLPDLVFQVVDVRDLARAHVRALEVEAPNKRYLCSSGAASLRVMGPWLRENVPGTKVPTRKLPGFLMYATALFEPRLTFGFLDRNLGSAPDLDTSRVQRELGVTFRPLRESVVDCGKSLMPYAAKKK